MATSHEVGSLTKAFSGLGVDENALVTVLGKWHPEQRHAFRKGTRDFFFEDERQFERWDDRHVQQLRHEFLRLKDAIVLWTMHPWERDARLIREALYKGPQYDVLIEIATTRSSDELLGARRAYHSLFEQSIEEDIGFHIHGDERKLLVGLVSAYRYEGSKLNDDIAKSEAKVLANAIKGEKNVAIDEDVVRILATRSKLHLKAVYKHYKEITGNYLDEALDGSLRSDVDENTKEAVTRVIVTRADVDMKEIKEEYIAKYGVSLPEKIQNVANGNYRDFLLTLVARGD